MQLERKMKPAALRAYLCNLPPCLVGMETCERSHHWARALQGYRHEAKLMATPFVEANKTDHTDVLAICEAVQRPSMRHVGIKSVMQQDQQSVRQIRSLAAS